VCQFSVFDLAIVTADDQTESDPAFFVQAMCPWNNLSETGYDSNIMIHGVIWDMAVWQEAHSLGAGAVEGLPINASRLQQMICAQWFVDTADKDTQAPVSILSAPRGPFASTPPIADPLAAPNDSELFPTRVLKRKSGLLKSSLFTATEATRDANLDAAGRTGFKWSGVLRKRFSVSSRQGFYFGLFATQPFNPDSNDTITTSGFLNGAFYYKLRR